MKGRPRPRPRPLPRPRPRPLGIGLALAAGGSLALLWLTDIPLGVPGEWTWSRIPVASGEWTAVALGWVIAAVVGCVYIGLVAVGAPRLQRAGRREAAAWLCVLCSAGFAWLWAIQECPARTEYGMAKSAWVLYYPAHEGYFDQARYVMQDVPSYLASYEQRMSEGDYLHLGTHPPGLILFHRACLDVCAAVPPLRDLVLRTEPASFREAVEITEKTERGGPRALTPNDEAALWLAALITQALAAATVVPLYLLVRRTHTRTTAWWTAALWPLVPALAVFLPKSDALLPFFGAMFLWLWLEGVRRGSRFLCALAGFCFWTGMFLSLAILPIGFAAALLTLWETFLCTSPERIPVRTRDWTIRIGVAVAGWAVPILLLGIVDHINLLAVWRWNYRNHAAFYEHFQQYPRTYWKWLLVNPLELGFAVGWPLIVAAAMGFKATWASDWRRRAMGPYWSLTAAWLVLWLWGENMGEAARLWLIVMPWVAWLAADFFAPDSEQSGPRGSAGRGLLPALALFAAECLVQIGTVTRVTGFDFPNLPAGQAVAVRESSPPVQRARVAAVAGGGLRFDRLPQSTR